MRECLFPCLGAWKGLAKELDVFKEILKLRGTLHQENCVLKKGTLSPSRKEP